MGSFRGQRGAQTWADKLEVVTQSLIVDVLRHSVQEYINYLLKISKWKWERRGGGRGGAAYGRRRRLLILLGRGMPPKLFPEGSPLPLKWGIHPKTSPKTWSFPWCRRRRVFFLFFFVRCTHVEREGGGSRENSERKTFQIEDATGGIWQSQMRARERESQSESEPRRWERESI